MVLWLIYWICWKPRGNLRLRITEKSRKPGKTVVKTVVKQWCQKVPFPLVPLPNTGILAEMSEMQKCGALVVPRVVSSCGVKSGVQLWCQFWQFASFCQNPHWNTGLLEHLLKPGKHCFTRVLAKCLKVVFSGWLKVVVLPQMVCFPRHCIQKKPGEPVPGLWDTCSTSVGARPASTVVGCGCPGSGVWGVGRPLVPHRGTGPGLSHCSKSPL